MLWISMKMSLKFVPKDPIDNNPALIQIIAWHQTGDKPLSEPMMVRSQTHICISRPQWVNPSSAGSVYPRHELGHHCVCRCSRSSTGTELTIKLDMHPSKFLSLAMIMRNFFLLDLTTCKMTYKILSNLASIFNVEPRRLPSGAEIGIFWEI